MTNAPGSVGLPAHFPPVPRAPNVVELGIGILLATCASIGIVGPLLVDPYDAGTLGTLVTPALVAVGVGIGASIAGGPRGRARLATALFESNRRYVGARTYVRTTRRTDRLAALGRTPVMAAVLLAGALVCFAKPIITPRIERPYASPSASVGLGITLSPAERAQLEAAAASGDPSAMALRGMILGPEVAAPRSHFTLDGYTAERNVAWPCAGAVLLVIALLLVLSRGGLSPSMEART